MSFADDLRRMPNKSSLDASIRNEQFKKEVGNLLAVIRSVCVDNRDNRKLDGIIARYYDNEYCQERFEYLKSLERDNTWALSSSIAKNGYKYSASMVSDQYKQERQGLKPISSSQTECQKYVAELGKLLKSDGFTVAELTSLGCYYEYDEVRIKSSGLFSTTKTLVRNKTNELLGYVIKFQITW